MGIFTCVDGASGQDVGRDAARAASRDELFGSAQDLVEAAMARLRREGIQGDEDDLRAWGRQGLLEAAERFEPERGDFRRFAYFRVRGAMIDGLRKSGNWSRRAYERVTMLRGLSAMTESLNDEPSAEPAQMTAPEAAQRLNAHMASVVTAMTAGVFAEAASEGEHVVPRDSSASVEDLVSERQLRSLVKQALGELPEPEGEIVRRHYLRGERIDHIAEEMGHTKSWASRHHTRAIRRLTQRLRGAVS